MANYPVGVRQTVRDWLLTTDLLLPLSYLVEHMDELYVRAKEEEDGTTD